jgi:hypothetical protein
MNYSDIQAQFLGLLNRRDITTTQAQTFIQMALQRIQRDLRVPAMEKSVVVTIQSGFAGLVIPTDMLELINIIPTTTNGGVNTTDMKRIEKCDISTALVLAINTGVPQKYARQGGMWILGQRPVLNDTIRMDYYAELAALVNPTDTNVITIIAPDLLVYGALGYAGDFYKDVRTPDWEARFTQIMMALQDMANEDEENGAYAVQPAFNYPDELTDGWEYFPYPSGVF